MQYVSQPTLGMYTETTRESEKLFNHEDKLMEGYNSILQSLINDDLFISSNLTPLNSIIYIYIYIYRERERGHMERENTEVWITQN